MADNSAPDNALLLEYAAGAEHLPTALAGLAPEQLDLALDANTWTIRQIVHHVADGDDLWKGCIKAALGSDRPFSLQWYWEVTQDRWAEHWHYVGRDVEPSLHLLTANRAHICDLLEHIPGALDRPITVRWPDGSEEAATIGDVVSMQVAHVAGHIEEINRIKQYHGLTNAA